MRSEVSLPVAGVLVIVALAGCLSSPATNDGQDPVDDLFGDDTNSSPYDPGWPNLSEAEIRPGVGIVAHGTFDNSCTTNFVFSSPDNRSLYIGSAAHCFGDVELGSDVEIAGISGAGTLAYCSWATIADEDTCPAETNQEGDDNDFALVKIKPEHRDKVHPAVLRFGGPTGIADTASQGDDVLSYGNSPVRDAAGDRLDARRGVVTSHSEWTTDFYLAGPGVPGDSGSDLLTGDGQALGVVTELGIAPLAGSNTATNIAPALHYANENTDHTFELKTWQLLDDGDLP